jgi:uroporphyrin-III C-methyltransferase
MTHDRGLAVGRNADTEVFYMAGKQLGALARRLAAAGWPEDVPVSVVSRAGWPDELASDHRLATLGQAAMLHAGRPTVVVVGAGARKIGGSPRSSSPARARQGVARTPST